MKRLSMSLLWLSLTFFFIGLGKVEAANTVGANTVGANAVGANTVGADAVGADSSAQLRSSINFSQAAEMAIASSVDLRNAYAGQRLMEGAWMLGLRAFFPRLGISASENDRLQGIGPDSFVKNYAVNVDQLLWDGGRTSMSRVLERNELNRGYSQLERAAADIAESALSAYRSVLSSRAVLAIREGSFESLVAQRRILAQEVSLGLALPTDLAEADLTVANAKIELLSLHSDLEELEYQFAEILGLDSLPMLIEKVDINRAAVLPDSLQAKRAAQESNPELDDMRFSILKRQVELKYAARQWLPSVRLQGSFGLNGRSYPLIKHNWSVGLSVELSGPWLQNAINFQAGWEPPYDRTAMLQNSMAPLPDPKASLSKHQAEQAYYLEQEKYRLAFERVGRAAQRSVEKCSMADKKRSLALEALGLAADRCRLEELRLELGQITRLDLMGSLSEYAQMEIAAVNAAVALLEAERELERLLDLAPGTLAHWKGVNDA